MNRVARPAPSTNQLSDEARRQEQCQQRKIEKEQVSQVAKRFLIIRQAAVGIREAPPAMQADEEGKGDGEESKERDEQTGWRQEM